MSAKSAKPKNFVRAQSRYVVNKDILARGDKASGRSSAAGGGLPQVAKKNVLQIVTSENVRNLIIPNSTATVYPVFLGKNQLQELQDRATVKTLEQRMAEMAAETAEKRRLEAESEQRRQQFSDLDQSKDQKTIEKTEMQLEKEEKQSVIRDKAFLARLEQEEEVQKANRLIFATKCHILRGAQVAEKKEIERELVNEDLRLEKLMMEDRDKALQKQYQQTECVRQTNHRFSSDLRTQLKERELLRLKEVERIEEESAILQQSLHALKAEEKEKERQRKERMAKTRVELQKANELSEYFKKLEFEEQRVAELKVQEYMKQKREREDRVSLEKRLAKEAKQRLQDKLFQTQAKTLESKSERDEMDLRRAQEKAEREFRDRERAAAKKKRDMEHQMAIARERQLEELKRQKVMQIEREEKDYNFVVKKLTEQEKNEQEKARKKKIDSEEYRREIIKQMNDKEMHRRENERVKVNEKFAQLEQEKMRKQNIKSVIAGKINQLKENNVPEKYVKECERQLLAGFK